MAKMQVRTHAVVQHTGHECLACESYPDLGYGQHTCQPHDCGCPTIERRYAVAPSSPKALAEELHGVEVLSMPDDWADYVGQSTLADRLAQLKPGKRIERSPGGTLVDWVLWGPESEENGRPTDWVLCIDGWCDSDDRAALYGEEARLEVFIYLYVSEGAETSAKKTVEEMVFSEIRPGIIFWAQTDPVWFEQARKFFGVSWEIAPGYMTC